MFSFFALRKIGLLFLLSRLLLFLLKIVVITATTTTIIFPAHTPSAEGHFQAPLARKKSLFSKDQFSISYIIIKFIVQFGQMNCQIKWCFLSIYKFCATQWLFTEIAYSELPTNEGEWALFILSTDYCVLTWSCEWKLRSQ